LLDPLWAGRQRTAYLPVSRTGRILSTSEELPTRQPPVCLACYRQGHRMRSRNYPLRLQESIATQSQALLDLEVAERPTTTISVTASIPAFSTLSLDMPYLNSQINLQLRVSTSLPTIVLQLLLTTSPSATFLQPLLTTSLLTVSSQQLELRPKQLSLDRPEVLMQVYLAKKNI